MLHIMQLLMMMNKEQIELFDDLFDDLSFELEEMGWKSDPETLINDILDNHLGFSFDNRTDVGQRQLKMATECILSGKHKAAVTTAKLRRGWL